MNNAVSVGGAIRRRLRPSAAMLVALVCGALAGCAGMLPAVPRTPQMSIIAAPELPLARAARAADMPAGDSGTWPLLQAAYALDARLALIDNARSSIDVQYYLIADDSIGRLILLKLRDAAARGVRVRLLVDDLDTVAIDGLLLGLAATPNIEVRLFNPIVAGRTSWARRVLALAFDFRRLNHRMHNKLLLADGSFAIVGGRNLTNDYFLRGKVGNYIDFDALFVGPVVRQLAGWFDLYWNATQVYPFDAIARAAGAPPPAPEVARAAFDAATREVVIPETPAEADLFGAPAFSRALATGRLQFVDAVCESYADSPNKADPDYFDSPAEDTLTQRFLGELDATRDEALLISPYFIPRDAAFETLAKLRRRDVRIRVLTNSLAVSDAPLVNVGLARRQIELLKIGVELYELSSDRLKLDRTLKGMLGSSIGRLHAKLAFIDRRRVFVGSMNLDPRSARINTEIGVRIESARLATMVVAALRVDTFEGAYQVVLQPDGRGVRWVSVGSERPEEFDTDPDTNAWERLRLMLLSWLVPDSQL